MTDRCKIGDIAIIIRDEIGCEANIGRMVHVCGPRKLDSLRGTVWYIKPVIGTMITYFDNANRKVILGEAMGIEHEDDWLLPIRPEDNDDAIDAAHDLPIPEVLEVA